jgi:hypothetical protein
MPGWRNSGFIVLGIAVVFFARTYTGQRPAKAVEFPIAEESDASTDQDQEPTREEMLEYKHRMNMTRHWRHIMIRQ